MPDAIRKHPVLLASLVFLLTKLPLLVYPRHWEELRDFDVFLQVAFGKLPYRDFEWQYGPLAPLLYGAFLKALPPVLLSVRLVSLLLWTMTASYVARILLRLSTSVPFVVVGTWVALSAAAVPNYSHNHVPALFFAVLCVHHFLVFRASGDARHRWYSYAGLLGCLAVRPVLAGYTLAVGWLAANLVSWRTLRWSDAARAAGFAALALGAMALLYGTALTNGFWPRPGGVYPSQGYPNLHYLLPPVSGDLQSFVRGLRAGLNTGLFYLHYFIWPTAIATLALSSAKKAKSEALLVAGTCAAAALCISIDGLHYGNASPRDEQIMWGRGQYFLPLTAISVLALFREARGAMRAVGAVGLALFVLFGNLPHLSLVKAQHDAGWRWSDFPVLAGTLRSPHTAVLDEALAAVNADCAEEDTVFIGFYSGGAKRLLRCREAFSDDTTLLEVPQQSPLPRGRSVYNPQEDTTVGTIVERRLAQLAPKYMLVKRGSYYEQFCQGAQWTTRDFGPQSQPLRLCRR